MPTDMAATPTTHREIITDIKKGNFAPIYLLMGEEPWYLDKIASWLEEKTVEEEARDFDQEIFFGADTSVEMVAASAQQYPVMGTRRLVMLKEAQSMVQYASNLGKLEGYALHSTPTTVLVIVVKGKELPAASKLVKAVKKAGGVVFVSAKVKEYQMGIPVREYCQEKGIGIDPDAIDLLVDFLGNSLNKVFGEIDKLQVSAGKEGARITRKEVMANIGLNKEFNSFEFVKALASKNYKRAMTIVNYFASNPRQNPVVTITGVLFKFYSQLAMAWFSPDRSDDALMAMFGMHSPWQLKDIKEGMRMYNASQATQAIHILRELDCKTKGIDSMQNEHALLREATFKLFTVR